MERNAAMTFGDEALAILIAKEEIRELAMLYSRAVDRRDIALLKTLYTSDATDNHGEYYNGPASGFIEFVGSSIPNTPYTGHHICNHLIFVNGHEGEGEGEVYAIALHILPDGQGGYLEYNLAVRYLDHYRKEAGRWLFASRTVTFDMSMTRPIAAPETAIVKPGQDVSYSVLTSRLFAIGPRS